MPSGQPIQLTEEQEQNIVEYYKEGHSAKEVYTVFGIQLRRLKRLLIKYNIPSHTKETLEQIRIKNIKSTNLEKYGVENVFAAKEIKNKIKQTCIEKYGVEVITQSELFKEKTKQTCIEKYGVEFAAQVEDTKNKIKATNIKKYGGTAPAASKEVLQKMATTTKARYGVEHALQNQKFKEKAMQTIFAKYGTYHAPSKHFIYNNIYFDSFPELCFYLYHIEHSVEVTREAVQLEYLYNDKKYIYYPDFMIDGKLYELKGDHLVNEDGAWQCPFDHELDELFEAKHQCALKNSVEILYYKDYKKYLDWFFESGYKKEDFIV